jgi:hypothetical protein
MSRPPNQDILESIKERKLVRRSGLNTQGHHRRIKSKQFEEDQKTTGKFHYKKFVDRNFMILVGGLSTKFD